MTNPIGVISMTYTRPFTAEHFPLFERMKRAGMDFCEILVPEPGELDPAAVGRAAKNAGLFLALAARVNVQRDLASDDAKSRAAGLDYLRYCIDVATACGAEIVGGPLYGTPLVFAGRPPHADRPTLHATPASPGSPNPCNAPANTPPATPSASPSSRSTASKPIFVTPPARPATSCSA